VRLGPAVESSGEVQALARERYTGIARWGTTPGGKRPRGALVRGAWARLGSGAVWTVTGYGRCPLPPSGRRARAGEEVEPYYPSTGQAGTAEHSPPRHLHFRIYSRMVSAIHLGYSSGTTVSDEEMTALHLERDSCHPDWNYTIRPRGA
jgi:hypothetical protein